MRPQQVTSCRLETQTKRIDHNKQERYMCISYFAFIFAVLGLQAAEPRRMKKRNNPDTLHRQLLQPSINTSNPNKPQEQLSNDYQQQHQEELISHNQEEPQQLEPDARALHTFRAAPIARQTLYQLIDIR